ncbi:hypothetical protein BDZ97DRAFT_1819398 [Flammula alnicola]|nr:hypothetical protein BDZ97DRAFT_1819398 [Flammula alnicola]
MDLGFDMHTNAFENPVSQPDTAKEDVEAEPERDDVYYFEIIVFKVENTLFRVPKSGFEVPGSFFETMFTLPGSEDDGAQTEGTDDKCPISLEGISKAHFRGFLRAMYPFKATALTYDEWVGALHLATMWDFPDLRSRSIEALSTLLQDKTATDKILLAKKYNVKTWLNDGYANIIIQTEALDLDQLRTSGIDDLTIARLFCTREKIQRQYSNNGSYCYSCGRNYNNGGYMNITDAQAREQITVVFASELPAMEVSCQ